MSNIPIEEELKNGFLVYSEEVNNNRAFPDARDGLKPSARATLWEMYSKGYSSTKPHVKCAKISGGTIANYWPHGDSGIYESMVRMSQPWINNLPEINWHGANGSQLGGPEAASSRYTECRLDKVTEEGMFSNIKKNVVPFIPNFSEDETWPEVLPALFPRLFVNGSQGIGYTIAQEWEPGNLKEFTKQVKNYLTNGKVSCKDIYPDYPSGGVIINKKDIHNIYETGKGSVILRAKTEIEDNLIKITELPYQSYAEPIIAKIKTLVNDGDITGIEDIYNKSDDNGLLIEIECSEDPNHILNRLFKLTDLQVTFSANQMALVNGVPTMLNLKDYIKVYTEHNIDCIVKEYTYDLHKALSRKEIVDGLIKAISIIDKVIETIKKSKSSDESKVNLINQFSFTENQAKAIVEMRLGRLANLECAELNTELGTLINTINSCNEILQSEDLQKTEFLNRLNSFTKTYGWDRRTQLTDIDIIEERKTTQKKQKSVESYVIALTADGKYIKKIKLVDYKNNSSVNMAVKATSKEKVVVISDTGKLYRIPVKKIGISTMKATGTPLNDIIEGNALGIYNGTEDKEYFFFITKNGQVKKISRDIIFGISKTAGTVVMKLEPDDFIIGIKNVNDLDTITVNTSKGLAKLAVSNFKPKGKSAGGVRGLKNKTIFEVKEN